VNDYFPAQSWEEQRPATIRRRAMLQRLGTFTGGLAGASFLTAPAGAQPAHESTATPHQDVLNARDFGASGNGKTDDTSALQRAIDAAAPQGGIVFLPPGNYLVSSQLRVKPLVTVEGVWRAPKSGPPGSGTTLLAVADKGRSDGVPFLTLERNATLAGLAIFYPEQTRPEPAPYPWTIRAAGDDVSLLNLLLVNPWQAVNLDGAGRHYIHGLYAQPLYRGLFIDSIYDVGRIDQVHLWPFWADDPALHKFTANNLESFVIGRTDWQYMSNCFTIFAKIGFRFIRTKAGLPNAVLTTCGSDIGPRAVVVDEVGPGTGVSFVNGQFMATIEVSENNRGPVKFTACGYWGVDQRGADRFGFPEPTRSHAIIRGTGHVSFLGCGFHGWNQAKAGDPCIKVETGGLTANACEFAETWPAISLGPDVEAAIILGNRFCEGSPPITNHMNPKYCQIGLNVNAAPSGRRRQPRAGHEPK
jgi:hypothetical protein